MKLGNFEVISLYENKFRIDGGALFGVIPKKIWAKLMPPDENNFITLEIHPLLIKTGEHNIIVDLGLGDALSDKMKKIYGVESPSHLTKSLEDAGISLEEVDIVIFSHLHADHSLGGLKLGDDGNMVKLFPNAKYYAHRYELDDALNPNERNAATYLIDLLRHYDEIQGIQNDGKIIDGIAVYLTGGHTRGHLLILVQSEGETLIYPGDIFPTRHHLKPAYIGAVDSYPIDSLYKKKGIINECLKGDYYIAFDHDPDIRIGKLKEKDGNIFAESVE